MKQRLALAIIRGLGRLPLGVARSLGAGGGWLLSLTKGRAVRVTRTNLALCFPNMPEKELARLVRQSLMETGRTACEIPVLWQHKDYWLRQHTLEYEGIELIRRTKEAGKGVIILTPHMGNWEILPCLVTWHGRITIMYQPLKDQALDTYIYQARKRPQVDMAPTDRRGVAKVIKALKAGEMVGILPDQVPDEGNGCLEVPFFGESAATMTLIHNLLQRTDCEVLISVAVRIPGGFKMIVTPCAGDIYSEDPAASVAALNKTIESVIAKAPAQYQWEYKRFKGRKQGEPY